MPQLAEVGNKYKTFTVTKVCPIPEIQCILTELTHDTTGARVIHLGNDDPENTFCLSLRTLPTTSNGVAHILEHTVLCGSEKFPVKDPFFAMTRRSLNTFMNAMTGQDYTCYPASSLVRKDFYNLLEVYLDAVFHPKLDERSFLQEGHRLEFTDPQDPSSPLLYKGIVYNEMKGAMSSPNSRLAEAINKHLCPDITYGVNSGGDPKIIPELTYEELRHFHETHYHPSRCVFYFYGNLPLQDHLEFLEKHCLSKVSAVPPLPPIPRQNRFSVPVATEEFYPFTPGEDSSRATIVSVSWLTCSILEQEELLGLEILETALLCTDASPLRKKILETQECQSVSSYLDDDNSEVPLTILMRGCKADSSEALLSTIQTELQYLAEKGVPLEDLESAFHQIELERCEILGDGYPYGLSLFQRCVLLAQHGGKPENGLMIHTLFDSIRKQWKSDPFFFEKLIKKHLLNNTHRVLVTLRPDTELESKENAEERAVLDRMQQSLSDQEKEAISTTAHALSIFQEEQEGQNLEVLPKVALEDVPPHSRDYPLIKTSLKEGTLYHHDCFTNDLLYLDRVCTLSNIDQTELPAAKLLNLLIPNIGNGRRSWQESLSYMQSYTGGIGASFQFSLQAKNPCHFDPSIVLTGKALQRNADKLLPFMRDIITTPDFTDTARIKELILRHHTHLQASLTQKAIQYAVVESAASLGVPQALALTMGGLPYFHWVRNLVENIDTELDPLIAQLQKLHKQIYGAGTPELVTSCTQSQFETLKAHNFYGFLEQEASSFPTPWITSPALPTPTAVGRVIAAPIAYCVLTIRTVGYTDSAAAHLAIAGNLFEDKVLHARIREQGGAYGAHASINPLSGIFTFYTYRDPNITSSYKAFLEAVDLVESLGFSDQEFEEAKLQVIQNLDNPVSPGSRGSIAHSWLKEGRSQQTRQNFRNTLLSASKEEVASSVRNHLQKQIREASPVVFGGKELLEKEKLSLSDLGYPVLELLSV